MRAEGASTRFWVGLTVLVAKAAASFVRRDRSSSISVNAPGNIIVGDGAYSAI